jgi:hypothetical protein
MQLLLKQSPASVDLLADVFNLTDGEKLWLLEAGVGEGLFFAGLNHVAIKIVASFNEDRLITTNPQELLAEANRTDNAQSLLEANAQAAEAAFSESTAPVPGAPQETQSTLNPETSPQSPPQPSPTPDTSQPS